VEEEEGTNGGRRGAKNIITIDIRKRRRCKKHG